MDRVVLWWMARFDAAGAPAPSPAASLQLMARRLAPLLLVVGALAAFAAPGTAHADDAAPSDFETTVVSVTPPTETITFEPVGGGAFVQLTVAEGTTVEIRGYQSEPFLRVLADGTVEANERSPSLYISREADGSGEAPAFADAALPPVWRAVGRGGRYAWHDHRAHWMAEEPPPGAEPGSRIMDGVVPLVVDGAPVEVAVAVDWLPRPSPLPLYVGAGAAVLVLLSGLIARRRLAWPLLLAGAGAGGIGWWQYRSLPTETGPAVVWWLLPAVAAVSALLAVFFGRRLLGAALVVLAGLELAVWAYLRRSAATRPVLPTDAPFWLERGVLAAVAVIAVVGTLGGLVRLARPSRAES